MLGQERGTAAKPIDCGAYDTTSSSRSRNRTEGSKDPEDPCFPGAVWALSGGPNGSSGPHHTLALRATPPARPSYARRPLPRPLWLQRHAAQPPGCSLH